MSGSMAARRRARRPSYAIRVLPVSRNGRCSRRGGFTLLEWMMVLVVFWLIIVFLFFPLYRRGTNRARAASCGSNLNQIGLALLIYSYDNAGRFPPADGFVARIDVYVNNQQIYMCPAAPEFRRGPPPSFVTPGATGGAPMRMDYVYTPGRTNDGPPCLPLMADSRPRHAGGANVLFTGGNVRWAPAREWAEMGFGPPSSGGDAP